MWHNSKRKQQRDHRLLLSMKTVNLNGNSFLPHLIFIFSTAAALWNYRTGQFNQQSFFFLLTLFSIKAKVMKSKDVWKCPLMIWVPHFFFIPQHTSKLLWKKGNKRGKSRAIQIKQCKHLWGCFSFISAWSMGVRSVAIKFLPARTGKDKASSKLLSQWWHSTLGV